MYETHLKVWITWKSSQVLSTIFAHKYLINIYFFPPDIILFPTIYTQYSTLSVTFRTTELKRPFFFPKVRLRVLCITLFTSEMSNNTYSWVAGLLLGPKQ